MSLRLKSRRQSPINGFRFEQPETGWKNWVNDPGTVWDFRGICQAILAHRQQNPRFNLSTDPAAIADEVDRVNAERMLTYPGGEAYVVGSPGGASPNPNPARNTQLAQAVAGVKSVARGAGILLDWIKSGGVPVDRSLAEHRASICASPCPRNGSAKLTDWFTVPLSKLIAAEIEERKDLNMTTSKDAQLGTCTACKCPLVLKVHTPLPHILEHLPPEDKAELWERCWILHETPNS